MTGSTRTRRVWHDHRREVPPPAGEVPRVVSPLRGTGSRCDDHRVGSRRIARVDVSPLLLSGMEYPDNTPYLRSYKVKFGPYITSVTNTLFLYFSSSNNLALQFILRYSLFVQYLRSVTRHTPSLTSFRILLR